MDNPNKYKVELIEKSEDLEQIYNLRVNVWNTSIGGHKINFTNFPNGWIDELDNNSFHFAIRNNSNRIIASSRITIIQKIEKLPYYELFNQKAILQTPVAFFSRLVVLPVYQKKGLSILLDDERIKFAKRNACKSILLTSHGQRVRKLIEKGFEDFGLLDTKNLENWVITHQEHLLLKLINDKI